MTAWSEGLSGWLIDFYAAASIVLVAAITAGFLIRQPVKRMAVAWATLVGLTILAVLSATPAWPRFALTKSIDETASSFKTPLSPLRGGGLGVRGSPLY